MVGVGEDEQTQGHRGKMTSAYAGDSKESGLIGW